MAVQPATGRSSHARIDDGQAVPFATSGNNHFGGCSATSSLVMADNGYGVGKFIEFDLRQLFKIRRTFETPRAGRGPVGQTILIELHDPDKEFPFALSPII